MTILLRSIKKLYKKSIKFIICFLFVRINIKREIKKSGCNSIWSRTSTHIQTLFNNLLKLIIVWYLSHSL